MLRSEQEGEWIEILLRVGWLPISPSLRHGHHQFRARSWLIQIEWQRWEPGPVSSHLLSFTGDYSRQPLAPVHSDGWKHNEI